MTSAFRAELEERDLLEVALAIVRPLHLRVDELQCKGAHASPALSAARKAFLGHLDGVGWSLWAMAKLLGYKSHASVSEVLGRKAPGKGKAVADPCAAGTGAWGVFPPGAVGTAASVPVFPLTCDCGAELASLDDVDTHQCPLPARAAPAHEHRWEAVPGSPHPMVWCRGCFALPPEPGSEAAVEEMGKRIP